MKFRHIALLVAVCLLSMGLTGLALASHTGPGLVILPALITNDTGSDAVNIQLPFGLSSNSLINKFYMNATGLNSDVQEGTTHLAFMPGTGQVQMLACFNNAAANETSACNNSTADDMTLPAANGESFEFAFDNQSSILHLNISTVAVVNWTISWEYFNGTSFVTASNVSDGTSGFTQLGQNEVSWDFPAAGLWPQSVRNGIAGYWFRAEVTAFTSLTTAPLGRQAFYETGRWWVFEDAIANNEQKKYDTHLQITTPRTFNYYFPHTSGVTASDAATLELTGSYVAEFKGFFDVTTPVTGTAKRILFKEGAFEVIIPSSGIIQVQVFEAP